ncbi:MAG: histidine kinase [Sediminibacterium sp.]|nr:histidine kinase [Sediminibacterium sp.]
MAEPEDLKLFHTLPPLIGLAVLIALGVILMVQQFQRSLYRRRLNEENLKLNHQRELLRTAITVQEKERERIAGDLHDELGARLSMTLMLLRRSYDMIPAADSVSHTLLPEVEAHLKEALHSTKRISYELMPPQLINMGLYKALLVLVEEVRNAATIAVVMERSEPERELNWPIQLGVYRMISELLTNTLKHAAATRISIELKTEEEYLICHYTDNGKGLPAFEQGQGLGLRSLEGRASALNGTLKWGTLAEGGFYAKICLPLAN